eukprot:12515331-Alexandrium_andersonii.AAC.1
MLKKVAGPAYPPADIPPANLPACSFLVTLVSNLAEPSSARTSTAVPADLLVPVDELASVKWP